MGIEILAHSIKIFYAMFQHHT